MEVEDFKINFEGHFESQGGGHGRINKCTVVFPCISKPLDHQEGKAYKLLQNTPLKSVIPKFFGIYNDSIVINDLTANFSSPCVMDVKVGTRHYDMYATEKKAQYLINKQKGSTCDSHGIRLIDAKVRKGGEVTKAWDKKAALKFTIDELKATINEFVPDKLKEMLVEKIKKIKELFESNLKQNPGFRMYASSVLVAYDGDNLDKGIRCCLIDFAHTFMNIEEEEGNPKITDDSFNDGVLFGLNSLINLF